VQQNISLTILISCKDRATGPKKPQKRNGLFWVVMQRVVAISYPSFGETQLKMGPIGCPKRLRKGAIDCPEMWERTLCCKDRAFWNETV
jgi:hypothetical protein